MGPRWPYWPQMAQNGQKWPFLAIFGHFGPFWACFFGVLERILAQVARWPKMAIFGHFWPFWASWPGGPISSSKHRRKEAYLAIWRPKMAQNHRFWAILGLPDGQKGPYLGYYNRHIWAPVAKRAQNGPKWPFLALFGPPGHRAQYPHLNTEERRPFWPSGRPKMAIFGHFWPFLAILGPFGHTGLLYMSPIPDIGPQMAILAPRWPKMAKNGHFWPFWAILGHFGPVSSVFWRGYWPRWPKGPKWPFLAILTTFGPPAQRPIL